MKRNRTSGLILVAVTCSAIWLAAEERHAPLGYTDTPVLPGQKWRVHDIDRPRPRMVTPGAKPGDPPSDAIVLFNGRDLSHWMCKKKGALVPPAWKLGDGWVECVGRSGDLVSREKFGDAQYHIEWAAPTKVEGTSQWRGNSGILLMERYEIQVLDSWNNPTYADGQAGAIYGQWPPLVNAVRPPGEWQSYDIVFEAPRFDGATVVKRANVTVFLNGILLHNRKEIIGAMAHRQVGVYTPHAPEEPLALQDHDTPVRYRNIWVRRLAGYDQPEVH
ncbi:MAG: DUF1080 domain-containing protein [Bryobacterales bacterium]|nr:DUF1080 domain-containing protein [Bryobacterales bacterium]